jgi:hypothetical protein
MSQQPLDGGPAFPQHGWSKDPAVLERMGGLQGMSLRDLFAAAALISSAAHLKPDAAATDAYHYADAMLRERAATTPPTIYTCDKCQSLRHFEGYDVEHRCACGATVTFYRPQRSHHAQTA